MTQSPSVTVSIDRSDVDPGQTLLIGLADVGAGSLTAVDYLVDHLDTTQIGWIEMVDLPPITPIASGEPRYPIRLYSVEATDICVLIGEQFVPIWSARAFTDAILDWATGAGIDECTILSDSPIPHRESEHAVFHATTPAFRDRHGAGERIKDLNPLPGGVLEGVHAELLRRGLSSDSLAIGVLVTPCHPPGPDFDASLRLLDALESIYPIDVDEALLQHRAESMHRYYDQLASRLNELQQDDQSIHARDFPQDRMYM